MYLYIDKGKYGHNTLYVKKSFRKENGKTSSKVVKNLGRFDDLKKIHDDPIAWAKQYIDALNENDKEQTRTVIIKKSQSKQIPKGQPSLFNGGYLFLQKLYYELGLDQICSDIAKRHKFAYDLNSILSRLVYGRILYPASKRSTYSFSQTLLEKPNFDEHQIYRALDVIENENGYIQSQLYLNSLKLAKRRDSVLYYDCTNFFFEIEEEDELREYGKSKENRPLPIVEMGLFIDTDGIPLAFSIHSGSTNEQITLKPLEQKVIEEFRHSRFVVCTDAGLSSNANRLFNNTKERGYITVQSVKRLKKNRQEKFMKNDGWKLCGDKTGLTFNLDSINKDEELRKKYHEATFYKEEWYIDTVIVPDDAGQKVKRQLEQRYIMTFSFKYKDYQSHIRSEQLQRAQKLINSGSEKLKKKNSNDCRRFISRTSATKDGEIAETDIYYIDDSIVKKEAQYDGYYCICTDLDGSVEEIVKVNHGRWEIEECFKIMKSEFKARPTHVRKPPRIKAHFMICFIALYLLRYIEKIVKDKYTYVQIVEELRNMNFYHVDGEGYIPTYTRTDFTDDMHELFGFQTDYEITGNATMKKIFSQTKKSGHVAQNL